MNNSRLKALVGLAVVLGTSALAVQVIRLVFTYPLPTLCVSALVVIVSLTVNHLHGTK